MQPTNQPGAVGPVMSTESLLILYRQREALRRQKLAAEALLRAEFKRKEEMLEERYSQNLRLVDQQIQEAEELTAAAACDAAQPGGSGQPGELDYTNSPLLPCQPLNQVSKSGQPILSPAGQATTCDAATPCGATDDLQKSSSAAACPGAEVITPQNVDQLPSTTLCQPQRGGRAQISEAEMCPIEREAAANGAREAAEADIPADAAHSEDADMATSEAEGVEVEEVEAVPGGEAGKPTSWWMFSMPRPGPDTRTSAKRLSARLWEGSGLEPPSTPVAAAPHLHRKRPSLRPLRTNMAELQDEDSPDEWAVALGDGQPELVALRRERQQQMLSLFAHPRKMRRRCLDNLQMPAESETSRSEDADASEGDEAAGFHIRRGDNLPPDDSWLEAGNEDEMDTADDPILPAWCPDPEQADPGDVEIVSEDEDGNIIPKGDPPTALQLSELLAANVPPAQELQVSKACMKDCWSLIAAVADVSTDGVPQLVAATMQHAERLNAGMPFPSAAGARLMAAALADKLEVIADSLEDCKARWEARQLPKLQLAAHKTWRQRGALLAGWQDDQAHVQGRLLAHTQEILFAAASQSALVRESARSIKRRCGTLHITLHDVLKYGHYLAVAALPLCPEPPPVAARSRKAQRAALEAAPMIAEEEGQDGEGEEDNDSASDLDSWLVSDSSHEQEDAAGPSTAAKHDRTAQPAAVVQSDAAPGTAAQQKVLAAGSPDEPAEKDAAESDSNGDSKGTADAPSAGRDEDCEGSKEVEAGTGAPDTQTQQPAATSKSPRELAVQPAAIAGVSTQPAPVGQHEAVEAGEEPEEMQSGKQEETLPESDGQPGEGSDQAMADASSAAEGTSSEASDSPEDRDGEGSDGMHKDGTQAEEEEPAESLGQPPADEAGTSTEQQEGRQAADEGAASEEAAQQTEAAVDLNDDDVIDLVNAASPQQARKRRRISASGRWVVEQAGSEEVLVILDSGEEEEGPKADNASSGPPDHGGASNAEAIGGTADESLEEAAAPVEAVKAETKGFVHGASRGPSVRSQAKAGTQPRKKKRRRKLDWQRPRRDSFNEDAEPAAPASQTGASRNPSMSPPSKRVATRTRASLERGTSAAAEQPQHSEPVQEANDEAEDEASDAADSKAEGAADGEAEGAEGQSGSNNDDDSLVGEPGTGKKAVRLKGAKKAAATRQLKASKARTANMQSMQARALEQQRVRELRLQQLAASADEEQFKIEDGYVDLFRGKKRYQIDAGIAKHLKPHQWEGVRFIWRNLVESFEVQSDAEEETNPDDGGGCILAHNMGLGKSFQTIAFLHSYHRHYPGQHTLVVMPKNVLWNWKEEFNIWLSLTKGSELTVEKVFVQETGDLGPIREWAEAPAGLLLITYNLFTSLTWLPVTQKSISKKEGELLKIQRSVERQEQRARDAAEKIKELKLQQSSVLQDKPADWQERSNWLSQELRAWQEQGVAHVDTLERITAKEAKMQGPLHKDLEKLQVLKAEIRPLLLQLPSVVVADEAHEIKNPRSNQARALMQISTKRRLALTGYPLQNRLMEYYTMVDWTQKHLLDSETLFKENFVAPITAGQRWDASRSQVREMQEALSVLQSIVMNFVHRVGPELLEKELQQKHEFVILLRLHRDQMRLYEAYVQVVKEYGCRSLFRDRTLLTLLCNQPKAFVQLLRRRIGGDANCINDTVANCLSPQVKAATRAVVDASGPSAAAAVQEAFTEYDFGSDEDDTPRRGKGRKKGAMTATAEDLPLVAAREILDAAPEKGFADKEPFITPKMLAVMQIIRICCQRQEKLVIFSERLDNFATLEEMMARWNWKHNSQYLKLDGQTSTASRRNHIKRFSDGNGPKVFLVSTLAGSLGINLVAASHMIVIDEPWNPVHNAQAVARIFRYGQKRETFIYRLLWDKTMEHKIYRRNLDKESLARQVVDSKNLRGMNTEEDLQLYMFERTPPAEIAASLEIAKKARDSLLTTVLEEDTCCDIVTVEDHQESLKDDPTLALTVKEKRRAAKAYRKRNKSRAVTGGPEQALRRSSRILKQIYRVDSDSDESDGDDDRQAGGSGATAVPPPAVAPREQPAGVTGAQAATSTPAAAAAEASQGRRESSEEAAGSATHSSMLSEPASVDYPYSAPLHCEAAAAPKSRLANCSLAEALEVPRSAPAAAVRKEAAGGSQAALKASGSEQPWQLEVLRSKHHKPRTASAGCTGQDRLRRAAAETLRSDEAPAKGHREEHRCSATELRASPDRQARLRPQRERSPRHWSSDGWRDPRREDRDPRDRRQPEQRNLSSRDRDQRSPDRLSPYRRPGSGGREQDEQYSPGSSSWWQHRPGRKLQPGRTAEHQSQRSKSDQGRAARGRSPVRLDQRDSERRSAEHRSPPQSRDADRAPAPKPVFYERTLPRRGRSKSASRIELDTETTKTLTF